MNNKRFMLIGIALSVLVGLSACSGGDTTTVTPLGNSSSTKGPITAFGSIMVNGAEYDTSAATIFVEGKQATEAELKVGMMVSVKKGSGNKAVSVHSDDEVEGIVISAPGTLIGDFNIMGQIVTVDDNTIFESKVSEITDASMITKDNIVEASGYSNGMGQITATRLEVKAASYIEGDELEVKGIVATHDAVAKTFDIGALTIVYSETTILNNLPEGIKDGLYVEVKSYEGLNGSSQLIASKIELESKNHDSDEDDEYELKGLIMEISDVAITVNSEVFIIDTDTEFNPNDLAMFAVGAFVEVEGYYNGDGDLVAKKIELEDNHDEMSKYELKGAVASIDAPEANTGTITLDSGEVVLVNNDTIMKDDSSSANPVFNLQDVAVNDYLEIKAIDNSDTPTTYTALKIKRKNPMISMP